MEKSTQWNPEKGIGPVGWVAMLLCIALFIYEHFWGNGFTTMVVMLYCSFLLPRYYLPAECKKGTLFIPWNISVPFVSSP